MDLKVLRAAIIDLVDILPEYEPSGDRTHSAWVTLQDLWEELMKLEPESGADFKDKVRELRPTNLETHYFLRLKTKTDTEQYSDALLTCCPEDYEENIKRILLEVATDDGGIGEDGWFHFDEGGYVRVDSSQMLTRATYLTLTEFLTEL